MPVLAELTLNVLHDPRVNDLEPSDREAPQLPALKRLSLLERSQLHVPTVVRVLPKIFPGLEQLRVESNSPGLLAELCAAFEVPHRAHSRIASVGVERYEHTPQNRDKPLYPFAGRHMEAFTARMYQQYPQLDIGNIEGVGHREYQFGRIAD